MPDFPKRYGPWAIVTGASSGIGEAFAHALARRGVRSMLVARRADELDRVSQEVREASGIECESLPLDLADACFIDAMRQRSANLDVGLVVSNAGYNPPGPFDAYPSEVLCRILDVNCRAPLLLAHEFLPRLRKRGRGGFLITGSIEGFFGVPYSTTYAASKNFVQAFGEGLWGESTGDDVDVLVLDPGATDTEIIRSRGMSDLPGLMQPEEVAECGLDRLSNGPTAIAGEQNEQHVAAFAAMPRSRAVATMGDAMKAAFAQASEKS